MLSTQPKIIKKGRQWLIITPKMLIMPMVTIASVALPTYTSNDIKELRRCNGRRYQSTTRLDVIEHYYIT